MVLSTGVLTGLFPDVFYENPRLMVVSRKMDLKVESLNTFLKYCHYLIFIISEILIQTILHRSQVQVFTDVQSDTNHSTIVNTKIHEKLWKIVTYGRKVQDLLLTVVITVDQQVGKRSSGKRNCLVFRSRRVLSLHPDYGQFSFSSVTCFDLLYQQERIR